MTQIHTFIRSLELVAAATKDSLDLTSHPGEDGRHIEGIIRGVLEKLLPKRFSIGSGFVINFEGGISRQQDIVLFDNIDNAPLLYEGNAGVFTAESVYATVEVKKTLDSAQLAATASNIAEFRKLTQKKLVHLRGERIHEENGQFAIAPVQGVGAVDVSPRTYLIAMDVKDGNWKDIKSFAETVARVCDEHESHLHGICVLQKDWFLERVPFKAPAVIESAEKRNALAIMYGKILEHSMSFRIHPAYLQAYFDPQIGQKTWNDLTRASAR